MLLRELILSKLESSNEVKASDIVAASGFSRGTVHLALKDLVKEGKLALLGKANQARYVAASEQNLKQAAQSHTSFHRMFTNTLLDENIVFKTIERETSILHDVPKNVADILYYAFTEMLNNAIEHSQSQTILVTMKRFDDTLTFEISDTGVGIFNNIRQRKCLATNSEAMELLVKGKQTTDPKRHSGEGIFFTSRIADVFHIKSSAKQLVFDNTIRDVFVKGSRVTVGTKVFFSISRNSTRTVSEVFSTYTDSTFAFSKTQIRVELYKGGQQYISRSQARRIVNSLDPFKEVILDFTDVETVGQGFADEVFRVWQNAHPEIRIRVENANEDVMFMINHAKNTTVSG